MHTGTKFVPLRKKKSTFIKNDESLKHPEMRKSCGAKSQNKYEPEPNLIQSNQKMPPHKDSCHD